MYVPKGDRRGRKNKYHIDREKFVFACKAVINDEMTQVAAAEYCGLPYKVFNIWIFRYFEPGIYGELPEDAFINYGLPRLGTKDGF